MDELFLHSDFVGAVPDYGLQMCIRDRYNTDARIKACEKGARFINMADYSLDMLKKGCLFTDWEEIRKLVDRTAKKIVGKELRLSLIHI